MQQVIHPKYKMHSNNMLKVSAICSWTKASQTYHFSYFWRKNLFTLYKQKMFSSG